MKDALEIIELLNKSDFDAYLIGPCMTELYMTGKITKDIDIATNATKQEVTNCLRKNNYKTVSLGIGFDVVTTIARNSKSIYNIYTFGNKYSSIESYLSSSEFTIYAMAYEPKSNRTIDVFNARKDINNKFIRTVGSAEKSFASKPIRMLKALRLRAELGFEIEARTLIGIIKKRHLIKSALRSDIRKEITRCFIEADKPSLMIKLMAQTEILTYIIPELHRCLGYEQNSGHKYDLFTHTMKTIDAVPKDYPLVRWAALFHDLGKVLVCRNYGERHASFYKHESASEALAKDIMGNLVFNYNDVTYIAKLVKHHMFCYHSGLSDKDIKKYINNIGHENTDAMFHLKYANKIANGTYNVEIMKDIISTFKLRVDTIVENEYTVLSREDLDITGKDIMKHLNIKEGPKVGELLQVLVDLIVDEPELNDRDILLSLL